MTLLLLAAALLAGTASPAEARGSAEYTTHGLTVSVPRGWSVVHRRLTPCVNPIERIDLVGDGAFLMLQESLDSPRLLRRFPARPRRFRVSGEATPLACCTPTRRAGWLIHFRDRGRAFYAYVYPDRSGSARTALRVLDGLRVTRTR